MPESCFLAICAMIKNETKYLDEWIDFHRKLGVEHFHIFDNESDQPVSETLATRIADGYVTVDLVEGVWRQLEMYRRYSRRVAGRMEWVAFIDADEFIVPRSGTIPDLLHGLTAAGLSLNWQMFGTSGHRMPPPGPVTIAYRLRLPEQHQSNHHVKTIVRPGSVVRWDDPHRPVLRPDEVCVGEDGDPVHGPFRSPTTRRAFIAHYWTRSWSDWQAKAARTRASTSKSLTEQQGAEFDAECTVLDPTVTAIAKGLFRV